MTFTVAAPPLALIPTEIVRATPTALPAAVAEAETIAVIEIILVCRTRAWTPGIAMPP
jgi:hypothetical protein